MLTEPQCLHWIERHSQMLVHSAEQILFYVRELQAIPDWETKAEAAMGDADRAMAALTDKRTCTYEAVHFALKVALAEFRRKQVADKLEAAE